MIVGSPVTRLGGPTKGLSPFRILACVVVVSVGMISLMFGVPVLRAKSYDVAFQQVRQGMPMEKVVSIMGQEGQWAPRPEGATDFWDDKWDGKSPTQVWNPIPIRTSVRYEVDQFPIQKKWVITFDHTERVVGKHEE